MFESKEVTGGKVDRYENTTTYKPQREHHQRSDRMRQHSPPKHPHPTHTHDQIPQEIACCEALDHAPSAIVAPDPLLPRHAPPLFIHPHHPERQAIHENTLHHGDDMDIPVQARAPGQSRVDAREEIGGEHRGDDGADELVGQGRQQELVDVKWQRW